MVTLSSWILCSSLLLASASGSTLEPAPPGLRLDEAVSPENYRLQLRIDPAQERFTGVVDVTVKVTAPTGMIWLNARDLEVQGAELITAGESRAVEVVDGGEAHIGLKFTAPLEAGSTVIRLTYSGLLRKDEVSGLFRRPHGEDWYVFSQMEPQDARRVFPGFDEPGFKVPFDVSMTVPPGQAAFFNTPRSSSETGEDGWTTVRFDTSKPLPTYLLAFGVGPFEIVDAGTAGRNKTRIRIIVPRGKTGHAAYAVAATGPILELLEDYFDMPYPYEKLDQIAIPNVGYAMEHPGLVTYGQRRILSAPEDETVSFRRGFANVCAHELAHMWFGDLVTMAWWDDLWLNESFATWMSSKIVDELQPDWDVKVQMVNRRGGALGADRLSSARQIRQPIESNDDVANAFDGITYSKGASVLRMFEGWMGEEPMRRGVRSYIKKNAHGNATAEDFLTELAKNSDDKMAEAFQTFVTQNGAPRLDVQLNCPESGNASLKLSQSRYEPEGAGAAKSGVQKWGLPVCVRYGQGKDHGEQCMLLTRPSATMTLETRTCPDWVLPNAGSTGYYHVAYDTAMLDGLFKNGGRNLTVPEQVGIVQDMQAMVAAGVLAEGDALARVQDLLAMENRHVISRAVGITAGVREMVPEDLKPSYARFIRETFGSRARALGWVPIADEDDDTVLLRPTLLRLVARRGEDPELTAQAMALTRRWLKDRSAIDPQLVDTVLRVAARNGDEALWSTFLEQARTHSEEKERAHLFGAMGAFRDADLIKKNLALVLSAEFEIYEVGGLIFGVEEKNRHLVYAWGRKNYDALLDLLPRSFQRFAIFTGAGFCEEERIADVETFFGPRVGEIEGGPRTLAQVLESMRVCAARRKSQQPSVVAFLAGTGG